jgi:hypothetical protein
LNGKCKEIVGLFELSAMQKKDSINIEALQLKYLTLKLPKSHLGLKIKNKKWSPETTLKNRAKLKSQTN